MSRNKMACFNLWLFLLFVFPPYSQGRFQPHHAKSGLSNAFAESIVSADSSLSLIRAQSPHGPKNTGFSLNPGHLGPVTSQSANHTALGITRRADTPDDGDSDNGDNPNPFRMPFVPDVFQFADFPPDQDIRNCAAMGVLSALRLLDAAVRALRQDPLSTSFARYFQPNQLCVVRNIFEGFLELSGRVPKTLDSVINRVYTIYYSEANLGTDWCNLPGRPYAYHVPPTFDFDNPSIVLCPKTWNERARTLEDVSCDTLRRDGHVKARDAWIGFIMLHEILHDIKLTLEVAGIQLVDAEFDEPDVVMPHSNTGKINAYGPYWSQYANDKHKAGMYNVDNYAYFAFEVFYAEICGLGQDPFRDPPFDIGIPAGQPDPF